MADKEIVLAPLSGVLDLRSPPDLIPAGGVRFRQNYETVAEGKLRRGTGWPKFLSKPDYNNADFHDQLLGFAGTLPQPVTLIHQAQSSSGSRSLIIGQQNRLLRLSEHGGNWKVLGSGFGGPATASAAAPRFKAARVGDYVGFTNDYDSPRYHILGQVGENGETLYEFDDFETIGLTRAKCLWSWRNMLIFANVEMDGQRFAYRIMGSDFNNPTSFDPAKAESITWQKDLMSHEEILAGAPAGNGFIIYTTHGIWEMTVVGGEQVVAFRHSYNGEDNEGKALLALPNVLVNLTDAHLFGGNDGLYLYNQYYARPERAEWLHRATSFLFDDIDRRLCEVHVSGIRGDTVLISVAETGQANALPNITLRINTAYKVCDTVDFGFTAFGQYNSQDIQSIRDFIIENRICTLAGLVAIDPAYGYMNEGLPNPLLLEGTAAFEPMSIYTGTPLSYGDGNVEDYTQENADEDSLCALLGSEAVDAGCRGCKGETLFVGAASNDFCLKQIGGAFYRETCANPTAVGTSGTYGYTSAAGSYILDGYDSILRFAPTFVPDGGVMAESFSMQYQARVNIAAPLAQIGLRAGVSGQISDPNLEGCLVWHQHSLKDLKCQTDRTQAEHLAANTQPQTTLAWQFIRKGPVLYFELKIAGVGGDADFSRVQLRAKRYEIRNI